MEYTPRKPQGLEVCPVYVNGFAVRGPGFNAASEYFEKLRGKEEMARESIQGREYFDNLFFQANSEEATYTDPQIRFLLELTFEALVEAGVSDFASLPKAEIGVYVGSSFGDFHQATLADKGVNGYKHVGAAGTMLANSISRFFKFGGISTKIDSACSSSLQALDTACWDIRSGRTAIAVVAGSNMILDPEITGVFEQMSLVRPSEKGRGACKPFCSSADGYSRQEAVVVMILSSKTELQAEGCSYLAQVLGHKSLTGSGKSITTPCYHTQEKLYRDVAAMAATHIDESSTVRYVECHGTGTKMGDETETAILNKVVKSNELQLYNKATLPLAIGSVKSNIAHTESASGLMSLVKVLLSLENGILPPCLHYTHDNRNRNCKGLGDGTLRVVTGEEPIDNDSIIVVNSFGFGGTYTQVMIRGATSPNPPNERCAHLNNTEQWININPVVGRTVVTAGRVSKDLSKENFSLAVGPPDVHSTEFSVRSFTTPEKKKIFTEAANPDMKRPIWLVFAGNGCVLPNMGYNLYKGSNLYRSIFTCCKEYLTNRWNCNSLTRLLDWQFVESSGSPFNDIIDATVCLVSVQICLINLLKMVGFTSSNCDGYIGHSAGEIVAGYFDGCYSLETTLDIAVIRARTAARLAAQNQAAMYVVLGLTRKNIENVIEHIDSSVDIACHTGQYQVTLSGLEADLMSVKMELEKKYPDVKIKKINTFGVPFHSKLINTSVLQELKAELVAQLMGVECKPRSSKWVLCGCKPGDQAVSVIDAEYHCQGFRNCVEFYNACQNIPTRGLIIECGPDELFRSIFVTKNEDNIFARHLTLLRGDQSAVETLATAYGHLYLQMATLSDHTNRRRLPKEVFGSPTQRATREAFLIWDHNKSFPNFLRNINPYNLKQNDLYFEFDLSSEYKWLRHHLVGGKYLLPAAVYLYVIWKGIRMNSEQESILEDFHIYQPLDISNLSKVQLFVKFSNPTHVSGTSIMGVGDYSDAFVHWGGIKFASCKVRVHRLVPCGESYLSLSKYEVNDIDTKTLYNQLGRHGYAYGENFRVISAMSTNRKYAKIQPNTFSDFNVNEVKAFIIGLDGMLQHIILYQIRDNQYGTCQLPVHIKSICLSAHLPWSIKDKIVYYSCLDEDSVVVCKSSVTAKISGVQLKTQRAPDTQLMIIDKKFIGPESKCSHQINDSQSIMPVHHFTDHIDLYTWKPQLKKLRGTAHLVLLISNAAGFAGFVNSLQKELGYTNIRGLQAPTANMMKSIPDYLINHAHSYFTKNRNTHCLFLCDGESVNPNNLHLMSERMQLLSHNKELSFPCPNGCFLTVDQQEGFCWKACGSNTLNSANSHSTTTCNVNILYASLNFRDVMIRSGKLIHDEVGSGLGLDFAGYKQERSESGTNKKVIGLGHSCIANILHNQPNYLCWELNDDDDLEAYASVPCVYATAYYALYIRGGLKENSKVLVHCGAGGVGQASLRLCKKRLSHLATQLFVTCGNVDKKNFLHEEYGIPMENIGDSRNSSFTKLINKQTDGKGVDMVINSLSGKLLVASIDCLSFGGILLELGKSKINGAVMQHLRQGDKQLSMIDLDQLMRSQTAFEPVRKMIQCGLQNKEITPIRSTVFNAPEKVEQAFEFMSSGHHIGKILLKMESRIRHATVPNIRAMACTSNSKKQVIIILGGLGGLGLCLAEFFAKRLQSACKLLLCSRTGISTEEQKRVVKTLRERYMVDVSVQDGDFTRREEVDKLFLSLSEADNLWAIINAAAATKDIKFDRMDNDMWSVPFAAKVLITKNFSDALNDHHFSGLQHFVCISSIVTTIGNMGQCNYACANAAMEEIVMDRVRNGKVGLSVRIGFMPYVGLAGGPICDSSRLRPVNVDCVLRLFEHLMSSTAKGIYAIYGPSEGEHKCSTLKDSVHEHDEVARRIFQVVQKYVLVEMDSKTTSTSISDLPMDSLTMILLSKELRKEIGFLRDLTTEKIFKHSTQELCDLLTCPIPFPTENVHNGSTTTKQLIVIATIESCSKHPEGIKLSDSSCQGLTSISRQTRSPDLIFVIFEDQNDFNEEALVEEIKIFLPGAKIGQNTRTRGKGSNLGALNSGIMRSFDETDTEESWIALLDTSSTSWLPTHLERCMMSAKTIGVACQMVTSPLTEVNTQQMPGINEARFFTPTMNRSALLVRRTIMTEAGLFDESMGTMADADLYIRLYDIIASAQGQLIPQRQETTGICTTKPHQLKVKTPYEGTRNDISMHLFNYKHGPRMSPVQMDVLCRSCGIENKLQNMSQIEAFSECQHVALRMWNGKDVFIRNDTYNALCDSKGGDSANETNPEPARKMLFGIITSDAERICGLLGDLGCMLNDQRHCVVIFANKCDPALGHKISNILKYHKFRSHVINGTDRIVIEVCNNMNSDYNVLPLSIAEARTVLQTFLLATTKKENFDVVVVIDDDLRLPKGWGVHDEDENRGDILLSRVIKTPPNPTVMSMRTQLLDFMFSLDSQHQKSQFSIFNNSQCPTDHVYENMKDQYYDLSSTRWDHLELPRRFECHVERDKFVEQCQHRILVGDPLAREAVPLEEGESLQRGGCMVLFQKNFFLMGTAQVAPIIKLASGRQAASRRSDSFWVQHHKKMSAKQSVVCKNLAVLHDNMLDLTPPPEKMRESTTLEMIGAILCRPIEDRKNFAQSRINALKCSISRIQGICKTLRGRPYFKTMPKLSDFVEKLEGLFSDKLWHQDVYEVVKDHLKKFRTWVAHEQPNYEVPESYVLDHYETSFLFKTNKDEPNVPYVPYHGIAMPIPCLHRFHTDVRGLCGAHKIQETIGMSLQLSIVEERLRQLAKLADITMLKAIVTIDDGFRDVMLLREIFQSLPNSLQPVLFLPSKLLREDDDIIHKSHLPLTCLYDYCATNNINPDDESVLGNTCRSKLKVFPEEMQYELLKKKEIPLDLKTDDLLSVADLKILSSEGWWIGMHGSDHSDLTTATSLKDFLDTLEKDCKLIRQNNWVPWFAWPEGRWCARVADAVSLQNGGPTQQFGLSTTPLGEGQHPAVVSRVIWSGKPENRGRILVTGGNGFLGRHLCLLLEGYGFDVFNFDITNGDDILSRSRLLGELQNKKITACVHLAAVADLNEAEADPENARSINVDGTRNVISCCDACGVRLLFASTCCIYGNNEVSGANNEDSPVAPTEIYAVTKLEGEKIVLGSPRFSELRHVIMRLATFYGPGQRGALATALFLEATYKGSTIQIHGSGKQTRCFTHVHDIANGIRVILQSKNFAGVVNVSDNQECSVNELVNICMKVVGATVEIKYVKDRNGQINRSMISNDRLRMLGNRGWKPIILLEDGLRGCAKEFFKTLTPPDLPRPIPLPLYKVCTTKLPVRSNCSGDINVSEQFSDGTQLVAYIAGNLWSSMEIPIRIHSECLFGDIFKSLKCDCGLQFHDFMMSIGDQSPGIFVYIKGHEGRGTDLLTKTRAYRDLDENPWKHHNKALLDAGARSVDLRNFDNAAAFTLSLIIKKLQNTGGLGTQSNQLNKILLLHTNNFEKVKALRSAISRSQLQGHKFSCKHIEIPAGSHCTPLNTKYLKEKARDNNQQGLKAIQSTARLSSIHNISTKFSLPQNIDVLPETTTRINSNIYDVNDNDVFNFFREFGFVVVKDLVPADKIKEANENFEKIVKKQFNEVNQLVGHDQLTYNDFVNGLSQFRDVFLERNEGNIFKQIIFDNKSQSLSAMSQKMMSAVDPSGDWNGMKLLHDHIITKPPGYASKKIPLHQDCMFWPVDIPALSTWTLLTDAPLDGGCMEIIEMATKPHQNRQNSQPVDFMSDELQSGLAMVLKGDPKPTRWLVPMKTGETLFLTSHTWHRSSRNMQSLLSRIAYIQTWVHPQARWRPDLVPWHPVNEYLKKAGFKPGDMITGERHPTISLMGQLDCKIILPNNNFYRRSSYVRQVDSETSTATRKDGSSISMFDASDIISTQICNILALMGNREQIFDHKKFSIVSILREQSFCNQLVEATVQKFFSKDALESTPKLTMVNLMQSSGCQSITELLMWVLKQLLISTAAYECNRSRNVFNSAYSAWWSLAGEAWNTHFLDSKFEPTYRLSKADVQCFLAKISVQRNDYDRSLGFSQLDLLEATICGCMEVIPFQNITMLTRVQKSGHHSPPTLGEIIKDMVTGLGGLCTVRNPFFFLLLNAMGFNNVRFVVGTMCLLDNKKELEGAHIALLVNVNSKDYWVDIANGFPYLSPLPLDSNGAVIIEHPFCNTRIVQRKRNNRDVYMVQHQFKLEQFRAGVILYEWIDNYYFEHIPVEYEIGFALMHEKHYNKNENFGPFLTRFRFNLWNADGGIILRGSKAVSVSKSLGQSTLLQDVDLDLWDTSEERSELALWIDKCGFTIHDSIIKLVPEAWARVQENKGSIKPVENITVTGGFFDNTADAYIGKVTVWRDSENNAIMGLTFRKIREYTPTLMPVLNKGFAGGSWYSNELYVCWPNRVAVVSPASNWDITKHIDNPQFNDLHHAHAGQEGIWVANTGLDSIDHLTLDGNLISRVSVAVDSSNSDSNVDIRDQISHDIRRDYDKEHVNFVFVDMPFEHNNTSEQVVRPMATLLQSKRVVHVTSDQEKSINVAVKFPSTSPPHEGFFETSQHISEKQLIWNSTVDGFVFASDPNSGEVVKRWNLSDYAELPRGWTRGLCLLSDGILVGSTCIRGSAKSWITRHNSKWNFDVTESCTAVSYIPFEKSGQTRSVHILSQRSAKIFSLLLTPPKCV